MYQPGGGPWGRGGVAGIGGTLAPETDREEFLHAVATTWEELDPEDYAFTRTIADQMREHDDREQFLAGIDLVLAGITAGEV